MGNYESRSERMAKLNGQVLTLDHRRASAEAEAQRQAAVATQAQSAVADAKAEAQRQAAAAAQAQAELKRSREMMEEYMRMMQMQVKETVSTHVEAMKLVGKGALYENEKVPPPDQINLESMRNEARQHLGIDGRNYNFGITGQTGSGKSSLVNAIRNVEPDAPEAAPTGETETTFQTKCYHFPGHPYVCFWDMPGAGTRSHPLETYFADKKLYAYDCLVVVTASRFHECDLKIAQEAYSYDIPVVFVRNKSDNDIKALQRRKRIPVQEAAKQIRASARDEIISQLREFRLESSQIFVLSTYAFMDPNEYPVDEEDFKEFGLSCAKKLLSAQNFLPPEDPRRRSGEYEIPNSSRTPTLAITDVVEPQEERRSYIASNGTRVYY